MINAVVDISHHNTVDFAALKAAGILGVIHKAIQGTSFIDGQFATRKPLAEAAGLMWGAYAFGEGGDGVAQAKFFLQEVGTGGIQVLDFEDAPKDVDGNKLFEDMSVQEANAFCLTVQQQTGRWPMIYCDASHAKTLLAESTIIPQNCPLWIAQYEVTPSPAGPSGAVGWPTPWKFWQYNNGDLRFHPQRFEENIDADFFNGTADELSPFWLGQEV